MLPLRVSSIKFVKIVRLSCSLLRRFILIMMFLSAQGRRSENETCEKKGFRTNLNTIPSDQRRGGTEGIGAMPAFLFPTSLCGSKLFIYNDKSFFVLTVNWVVRFIELNPAHQVLLEPSFPAVGEFYLYPAVLFVFYFYNGSFGN